MPKQDLELSDVFSDPVEVYPLEDLILDLKDKYNLRQIHVEFLFHRPRFNSDAECARYLGLEPTAASKWRNRSRQGSYEKGADFKSAYQEYVRKTPEVASYMMRSLYPKAVARTSELLDATKTIVTKTGLVEVPDHSARSEGIKIVLGHEGKLNQNNDFGSVMTEFADFIRVKKLQVVNELREEITSG